MDAITTVPVPSNEPINSYAPGSPERARLRAALNELAENLTEICHVIDGHHRPGTGAAVEVVQPHRHAAVLGTLHVAEADDARDAVTAATDAAPSWRALPFDDRAAIFLRAADLLAGPWRETIAAATMLGQSKTPYRPRSTRPANWSTSGATTCISRAEILAGQPKSSPGVWNRTDTGPSRASSTRSRRSTSPRSPQTCRPRPRSWATRWCGSRRRRRPSRRTYTMRLLEAAGLPPGVINLVHGDGQSVVRGRAGRSASWRASTSPVRPLPSSTSGARSAPRSAVPRLPRLVGETGGKDFVLAHPSADAEVADDRADSRRLRISGPEVLGGLARVRPPHRCGRGVQDACSSTRSAR